MVRKKYLDGPQRPSKLNQNMSRQDIYEEDKKLLATHISYLGYQQPTNEKHIKFGDVVEFMYDGETKMVFVLNPVWKTKLHGLSLKYIDHFTLKNEILLKEDLYRDPLDFYKRVVKIQKIADTKSYRTYEWKKITKLSKRDYRMEG